MVSLPEGVDQSLLRWSDAVEASQQQPFREVSALPAEIASSSTSGSLLRLSQASLLQTRSNSRAQLAERFHVRTSRPPSAEEVECSVGAKQGVGLLRQVGDTS